jgi:Uncharacterised nucleotidyltransferase
MATGPEQLPGTGTIPLFARVHLAHAAVQRIADRAQVPLLHLKGPALLPGLRPPGRLSSDADVLVHPDGQTRFEDALRGHGWQPHTQLATGSAFEHAVNWWHPHWGYVDVHARWPGPTAGARETFAAFAEDEFEQTIAHVPCRVPGRTAQILVLLLHGARSQADRDLELSWHRQSAEQRAAVVALADRLGARVALAAALGELEAHRDDPAYELWRYFRDGGGRLDEWRARFRAARGLTAKLHVVTSAARVNRDHLRVQLGRPPTRRDLRRAQLVRVGTLGREGTRLLLRRVRDRAR